MTIIRLRFEWACVSRHIHTYIDGGVCLFAPQSATTEWRMLWDFDYDFLIQLLFKSYNFIFTARAAWQHASEEEINYKKIYMATLAACK